MQHKRILSSLAFFAAGIVLFLLVYRKFNFGELIKALKNVRFSWIFLSVVLGLLSHYVRAIRWKMLINTMGYRPGNANLFLSVIILYFTNLIIPRGGEVSRCGVISKYESIPIVKLAGTVFVERMSDLFTFLFILIILVLWQFNFFKTVFNYLNINLDLSVLHLKILPVILILSFFIILLIIMAKFKIFNNIYFKIKRLKEEFTDGTVVILKLKEKTKYVIYTFIIFILWFLMLYAMFFAYTPTNKLSFVVAVLTYSFGNIAFLLPIQAGIGAWHFLVINCLFFFGIDKESGMIFALIAHTFTSLIFLIFGPIAMALLPIVNKSVSKSLQIDSDI